MVCSCRLCLARGPSSPCAQPLRNHQSREWRRSFPADCRVSSQIKSPREPLTFAPLSEFEPREPREFEKRREPRGRRHRRRPCPQGRVEGSGTAPGTPASGSPASAAAPGSKWPHGHAGVRGCTAYFCGVDFCNASYKNPRRFRSSSSCILVFVMQFLCSSAQKQSMRWRMVVAHLDFKDQKKVSLRR